MPAPALPGLPEATPEDPQTRQGRAATVDFARDEIQRWYIEPVDSRELFYGEIDGMLQSLHDPNSLFRRPMETRRLQAMISGSMMDLGLNVERNSRGELVVSYIYPDSPAAEGRMSVNDRIDQIDGKPQGSKTLEEIQRYFSAVGDAGVKLNCSQPGQGTERLDLPVGSQRFWEEFLARPQRDNLLLRGRPASELDLQTLARVLAEETGRGRLAVFERPRTGKSYEVLLRPRPVRLPAVIGRRLVDAEAGLGYFRVSSISSASARDITEAIEALRKDGLRGLVLDLRYNPGGVVDDAIRVAELFLPKDRIVAETRGRVEEANQVFRTAADGPYLALPLVLLVDEGTASAAEIIAAALQGNDRALLVGQRTRGSGLTKKEINLPCLKEDGQLSIQVTNARLYTPTGSSFAGRGLAPDHAVTLPGGRIGQIFQWQQQEEKHRQIWELERKRRQSSGPAATPPARPPATAPAAAAATPAASPLPEKYVPSEPPCRDEQLELAVRLLRGQLGLPVTPTPAPSAPPGAPARP